MAEDGIGYGHLAKTDCFLSLSCCYMAHSLSHTHTHTHNTHTHTHTYVRSRETCVVPIWIGYGHLAKTDCFLSLSCCYMAHSLSHTHTHTHTTHTHTQTDV